MHHGPLSATWKVPATRTDVRVREIIPPRERTFVIRKIQITGNVRVTSRTQIMTSKNDDYTRKAFMMPIPSHERTFVIDINFISRMDVRVHNERGKAIRATHPHGGNRTSTVGD